MQPPGGPRAAAAAGSYLDLRDQDVGDASQHRHKVKHIPGSFQVVLSKQGHQGLAVLVDSWTATGTVHTSAAASGDIQTADREQRSQQHVSGAVCSTF